MLSRCTVINCKYFESTALACRSAVLANVAPLNKDAGVQLVNTSPTLSRVGGSCPWSVGVCIEWYRGLEVWVEMALKWLSKSHFLLSVPWPCAS